MKNDRLDNFDFDLEEVVRFEGETGPYVQYTNARAQSILRKANQEVAMDADLVVSDANAWDVLKMLGNFPDVIVKASQEYEPSVIAKYALRLAKAFNKYYANSKILADDDQKNARLSLVKSVSTVLEASLDLLGVQAPKAM